MQSMKNQVWAVLAGLALFASCKKADLTPASSTPPVGTTGTAGSPADALKDSALLYSRDLYLWYGQIPSGFNARSYDGPDKVMTAIRQYSTEPGFSAPVDRWSFAMKQAEWDNVSAGISGDFGLTVFFRTEGDLRVKAVEAASPAGLAGVRRGWRITAINGNTTLTTANASMIVQAIYQSSSASISFQKPDNSTVTLNLSAAQYFENPVVLDTVYTVNAQKVGYFVFSSFLGDTASVYNAFSRIFNRFASAGVNDVIVDLRYNGGGYVTMAQKLANYLAPASANGQAMMTQQFNNKYSQYDETEPFHKLGALNLSRVFFIVSNATASASELLINNLRPYMDVQLAGPSKTYGKPVGFFPIPAGDWYIFPVSFKSVNRNGEGNYYSGLPLNSQVADGLDKDWGNTAELSLQAVLSFIAGNGYRTLSIDGGSGAYQEPAAVRSGNSVLDGPSFKGTIDPRRIR